MRLQFSVYLTALTCAIACSAQPMTPEQEDQARKMLRTATGTPTLTNQVADERLNIPFLYGVVILTNLNEVNPDGVPRGLPLQVPPGDKLLNSEEFSDLILRCCQRPMSTALMQELQTNIIRFYRKHDRPLVDVLCLTDQPITNGVLQLVVLEGKLGQVKVQDTKGAPYTNGWSSEKWIREAVRFREGDRIATRKLVEDLDWLNRNPFRKVRPLYEPGRELAQSDLLVRVDDRLPFTAGVGYENTGTPETQEGRILAGFTWGKAFGLHDNLLSYQFVASPDFDSLLAHVGSYVAPLPWRHTLRFFGAYADVKSVSGDAIQDGTSYQTSMRYEIPLPILGRLQHEFALGLDFKHYENSLLFGVNSPVNTPYNVFQLVGSYAALLPDVLGQSSFTGQIVYSPGDVTSRNTDTDFDAVHEGATADYIYGRLGAERETTLFWRLAGKASAETERASEAYLRWILRGMVQLSDANLVPSEQFGLGGYTTVRGYSERQANGDHGWMISNELRTPALSPAKAFGLSRLKDRLEFLVFWDYGVTGNKWLVTGEDPTVKMSGIGPGFRYTIGRHLAVRFDYGFPLIQTDVNPDERDDPRAHGSVVISY